MNFENFITTIGLGSGSFCRNCRNRNSFHRRDQAFTRITRTQFPPKLPKSKVLHCSDRCPPISSARNLVCNYSLYIVFLEKFFARFFFFNSSICFANLQAKKTVRNRRVDDDSQAVYCKNVRTARIVSDWTVNSSANSAIIYRELNG